MKPIALLVHVSDIIAAKHWYLSAFPDAQSLDLGEATDKVLQIQGFQLEDTFGKLIGLRGK